MNGGAKSIQGRLTVLTLLTSIAGLKVGRQILGTGMFAVQIGIRDWDDTGSASGAAFIYLQQDVGRTPDVTVVTVHTATVAHTPVERSLHDDHFVRPTCGVEVLKLAVVFQV